MLATGILTGVFAATAAADTANSVDDVLSTLADLGITEFGAADLGINGVGIADLGIAGLGIAGLGPVDAGELERSLCPVLADRGQDAVDVDDRHALLGGGIPHVIRHNVRYRIKPRSAAPRPTPGIRP